MVKKVAVVGAGAAGLPSVKVCLDHGLEPVCFERFEGPGGLWNFCPEVTEGRASVMKSTIINTSKEMLAYSDFPMPEEAAPFMHNTGVMDYFNRYIQHFGLDRYIRYNTEVVSVRQARDYSSTGRWDVRIRHKGSEKEETLTFDAVMMCTGHHSEKLVPEFPGLSEFQGQVMHAQDYKEPASLGNFQDKRVLIVGVGNTGVDIAVELGHMTKQVFMSTRRGTWVVHTMFDNGVPYDFMIITRWQGFLRGLFPQRKIRELEDILTRRFDHEVYGLKPAHGLFQQYPTLHDGLPKALASGGVKVRPNVQRFTRNGVVFSDGTTEDVDAVILATGYKVSFPMLEPNLIKAPDNNVRLYKYEFLPSLPHPTLAVIGLVQPFGAAMPIFEMQARLAVKVFTGEVTLPPKEKMEAEIDAVSSAVHSQFVSSPRHTMIVDILAFMNELAAIVGCKPRLWRLLVSDPKLWSQVVFGPFTAYQFRLHGPNSWPGARKAILSQWERTFAPMKQRSREATPPRAGGNSARLALYAAGVVSLGAAWVYRGKIQDIVRVAAPFEIFRFD